MIIRGIVAVVVRLLIGRLVDKVAKRRKVRLVAFIVMVLFSLSTMLCTLTTSFSMFIAYMAFISVVDSVYWLILPLLSKEITRNVHTDKAIVLVNCIASFATLGGPPTLGENCGNSKVLCHITKQHSRNLHCTFTRSALKKLGCASFFQHTSRICDETLFLVFHILHRSLCNSMVRASYWSSCRKLQIVSICNLCSTTSIHAAQ